MTLSEPPHTSRRPVSARTPARVPRLSAASKPASSRPARVGVPRELCQRELTIEGAEGAVITATSLTPDVEIPDDFCISTNADNGSSPVWVDVEAPTNRAAVLRRISGLVGAAETTLERCLNFEESSVYSPDPNHLIIKTGGLYLKDGETDPSDGTSPFKVNTRGITFILCLKEKLILTLHEGDNPLMDQARDNVKEIHAINAGALTRADSKFMSVINQVLKQTTGRTRETLNAIAERYLGDRYEQIQSSEDYPQNSRECEVDKAVLTQIKRAGVRIKAELSIPEALSNFFLDLNGSVDQRRDLSRDVEIQLSELRNQISEQRESAKESQASCEAVIQRRADRGSDHRTKLGIALTVGVAAVGTFLEGFSAHSPIVIPGLLATAASVAYWAHSYRSVLPKWLTGSKSE